MTKVYFRGAAAAILVYSIDSKHSFDSLPDWLASILSVSKESMPIALLGNKKDLECVRQVSNAEAQSFVLTHSLHCSYEVSALTGENVETALCSLVRRAMELRISEPMLHTISLSSSQQRVRKRPACC